MRHVHVKQDMVTRTTKLVNAGIIPREPAWVTAMKRLPPQVPAPRDGKPPKIVLPTDRLYRIRDSRFKAGKNMPYFAHGEFQSQAMVFAQRQWGLMKNRKLSEKDAYSAVESLEAEAKTRALTQVQELTASLKASQGAEVPELLKLDALVDASKTQSPPHSMASQGMSPTFAESDEARLALQKAMGG